MRLGISVPTFGEFADVRVVAELAADAEQAGWDGFFVWDHVLWPWADELADPLVAMTAVALRTERLRFGPLVTPLSRRRPAKVARETVTLDRLSGGRLVFGAGSGAFPQEFDNLGEATDARTRAELLDESLDVLTGLWSGRTFGFDGKHHQVRDTRFRPTPAQQPRIPIWIGGQWPLGRPLDRALRWDGYVPLKPEPVPFTATEVEHIAQRLGLAERPGFDLVICGPDGDIPGYARAGATWWIASPAVWDISLSKLRAQISAGPPPLSPN